MRVIFLAAAGVMGLGLSPAWGEAKAVERVPAKVPYQVPGPVRAAAEAPESAAGKTLRFTYPAGAGVRHRDVKKGAWSPWTRLAASSAGNFTFDAKNTYTTTSGGGGIREFRSTVTYTKTAEGEARVTKETVGVGHSYKAITTYRLVFTSPTSGTAFAHTVNDGSETEMTHFRFTLE